jgi:tetratricopeptide (TPR) repeat protein
LFAQAEEEFRSAIHWAIINEQPRALFYSRLGWIYIERSRFSDALLAFQSAYGEAPDYFEAYWGSGRALAGLGQCGPAADALRSAIRRAPVDLQSSASEEITLLLAACEAAILDQQD